MVKNLVGVFEGLREDQKDFLASCSLDPVALEIKGLGSVAVCLVQEYRGVEDFDLLKGLFVHHYGVNAVTCSFDSYLWGVLNG